jgi:hypothetical protein
MSGIQFKVGSFIASEVFDDQIVTGIGFQPKALITFANWLASNGSQTDYAFTLGMVDSALNQSTIGTYGKDNASKQYRNRKAANYFSYLTYFDGTSVQNISLGAITSLDSDGWHLFWDVSSANRIHYLALGGANLSSKQGSSLVPTVQGSQSITGIGFKPDCVLLMSAWINQADADVKTTAMEFSVGAMERNGSQGVNCAASNENGRYSYQDAQHCIVRINLDAPTGVIYSAWLTSMDTDGFTLFWDTVSQSTTNDYFWLALKGIGIKIGEFTHGTEVGNLAVTGLGFRPNVNLFASACSPVSTSVGGVIKTTFGAGQSPTEQGTVWAGED